MAADLCTAPRNPFRNANGSLSRGHVALNCRQGTAWRVTSLNALNMPRNCGCELYFMHQAFSCLLVLSNASLEHICLVEPAWQTRPQVTGAAAVPHSEDKPLHQQMQHTSQEHGRPGIQGPCAAPCKAQPDLAAHQ